MTFENLKYFVAAAEEMNFTKAAQKLFISQQSLSGHIAKMEEYYGCKLFNRAPPLTLTQEGVLLLEKVRTLLSMENDIKREVQDIHNFQSGTLSIGITRVRGGIYLSPVLSKYHQKYPNIRLNIFEGSVPEVEDALRRDKVDVSIGFRPKNGRDVTSISFWKEHIVAVVPHQIMDALLAKDKTTLLTDPRQADWRLFQACPFVAINPTLQVGKPFAQICGELDMTPNIVLEAQSIDTVRQLCIDGMGILVCAEIFLYPVRDVFKTERSRAYVFPWNDSLSKDICINHLKTKYLSVAAKKFVSMMLQEEYQAL